MAKNKTSNPEFDRLKLGIVKNLNYSGSESEIEALKQVVLEYVNNPEVSGRNKPAPDFKLFEELHFVLDNDKTGRNTCNLNISSGFGCYECLKGHCNVQSNSKRQDGVKFENITCYSLANENRLPLSIIHDINNYIVFNTLSYDKILSQIKTFILENECFYLRFNEKGSFYSLDSFKTCDKIAMDLKNYVISYSYTSNKILFNEVYKTCFMALNLSLGFEDLTKVQKQDYKQTIVIEDNRDCLEFVMAHPETFKLCTGYCSGCSNCKDDDTLVTVFIRHGAGHNKDLQYFMGVNFVTDLKRQALFKNMAFVSSRLE